MEVCQSRSSPSSLSVPSPTFTSYSSQELGDIAARVVGELNLSISDPFDDNFYASLHHNDDREVFSPQEQHAVQETASTAVDDDDDDDDDDSEFEFAVLCRDDDSSPISADDIFSNGQIRPMFPIFNTDLVFGLSEDENDDVLPDPAPQRTLRLPLRKLLTKERENSPASSLSSEAEDLNGIPPGTYCVWTPKEKKEKDMIGKKSHSTGSSSKRFRIRDLLYRSNSDGKDAFVFITPANHHHHGGAGNQKRKEKVSAPAKKKVVLEGKKKSYLPYRKDLVGFFANVNSVSRTVRPF